ncbi:metal-dependent hydrolase [Candidatus Woesearchaeota archaeon]|nr:metal-dependent hydrolase [Candidatus Woesearchaeota archaeon]
MPNADTHAGAGALTSLGAYLHLRTQKGYQVDAAELVGVGICGAVVGQAPDWIDPPTSPQHRGIGHSALLAGIVIRKLWDTISVHPTMNYLQKDFSKAVLLAYLSHLGLDAFTPAGLPG